MNKKQALEILQGIPWNSLRYSKGGERTALSERQLQAVSIARENLKGEPENRKLSIVEKAVRYFQDSGAFFIQQGLSAYVRDRIISDLKADLILPSLPLDSEIAHNLDSVAFRVTVGSRDWEWDRRTGKLLGTGTAVGGY